MKRRIALILIAVVVFSCLSGCAFTAVNDPVGLSKDEAVSLVFDHFGVDIEACKSVSARDDGDSFDVEFIFNGKEYEAEVDKKTGRVTEIDIDGDVSAKDTARDDTTNTPADIPSDTTATVGITEEEAKIKALEYFDVKEEDASFLRVERDDGKYEIEFRSGNIEYDIEIRISDGTVVDADSDREDKWD